MAITVFTFQPFIARLKAATLFNSSRFFGNEFQIWLPLKDSVSKPLFVIKTLGTLSLNIHLNFFHEGWIFVVNSFQNFRH